MVISLFNNNAITRAICSTTNNVNIFLNLESDVPNIFSIISFIFYEDNAIIATFTMIAKRERNSNIPFHIPISAKLILGFLFIIEVIAEKVKKI